MKLPPKAWLGLLFLAVFVLIAGVILLFAFLLSGERNPGGINATLSALLTQDAIAEAVATRVAEEVAVKPQSAPTTPQVSSGTQLAEPTQGVQPSSFNYTSQPGDSLEGIAGRFDVSVNEISLEGSFSDTAFLPSGRELRFPYREQDFSPAVLIFPDSAIVYGLQDVDFDLASFVVSAGGFLAEYEGDARGVTMNGVEIVRRVALEHSISPKLLLALLEYRSGWVYGNTPAMAGDRYPIGYSATNAEGLYEELYISARLLGYGYYGWRDGSRTSVKLPDGESIRLHPALNAGTAAIANVFAGLEKRAMWEQSLYSSGSIVTLYTEMFGDPWQLQTPQIADWLTQPEFQLPFESGDPYHLTSGPHRAWGLGSPWAAVDFAPQDDVPGCAVSPFWVTAAAAGRVVRSENGVVVIDLDGDGLEQTGWVLFYLHIADSDRVQSGDWLEMGGRVGHASCEGGSATGTHLHIARKYNGEWIPADGAIPFMMSGWRVVFGESEYKGSMVRGEETVTAHLPVNDQSRIMLEP